MRRNSHRLVHSFLILIAFFATSIRSATAAPGATTTTLTVSSAGNAVTSVNWGPVTFIAAVASNSAKVTTGQVKFCDASASYCIDAHLLGMAQLTSAGTAVVKLLPPPGSHNYKAVFVGTKMMAASSSATVGLTVTGLFPSVVGPTSTPSDPIVAVGGGGTQAPTGTVSLVNASTNAIIGTQTLPAGGAGFGLIRSEEDDSNTTEAGSAVVGDFNNDGFPDIAEGMGSFIRVLLGDGTGHFKASSPTPVSPGQGQALVAGDFNGDGVLDLAMGGGSTLPLMIFLGNGDGTFKQGQTIAAGTGLTALVTGDFNGDGIPDLAFDLSTGTNVFVYLGNGDGTFTGSPLAPPATGSSPYWMVAGDFNGDGISDLAVVSEIGGQTNNVEVFLSNGDGSFSAPIINGTASVGAIAACDFNGDGHLDLAVSADFTTTILLSDGQGNFSTGDVLEVPPNVRGGPATLACADFNGDGAMDLAFVLQVGIGTESGIMLGDGAGNFGGEVTTQAWTPLAEGDFNGDGLADLVDQYQRFLSVTQSGNADFSGSLTPGSGSPQVVANYSGDSNFAASSSAPFSVQTPQGTPSVTVTASAASITEGWPLTVTVTGGGVVPTGSVMVYDGSAVLGTVTLNNAGVATISATTLAVGANSITAAYGGDANYVAATSAPLILTVTAPGATASTVAVKPASSTIVSGQALSVSVTVAGPSGGASPTGSVNLSTGSYSAWQSLSSGAASFTVPAGVFSSGTNTLTASYPGDPTYAASNTTATVTLSPVAVAVAVPPAVAAGSSATATVTFTSGSSYQGTLNLSCALTTSPAGAQSLPTCTLSPTSLALPTSGTGTSVLTVKTTPASTAALRKGPGADWWRMGGGGVMFALVFTCGLASRRRRWISMLALLAVFSIAVAMGCGGGTATGGGGDGTSGSTGTTAGNYVFTLTGTDTANSSLTATATITVSVQ